MIRSFADRDTARLWDEELVWRYPPDLRRNMMRKLMLLNVARGLDDLRIPRGNRLKKLWGDREGQYSIRVNDQWRVCFRWEGNDAYDVELVDYH